MDSDVFYHMRNQEGYQNESLGSEEVGKVRIRKKT